MKEGITEGQKLPEGVVSLAVFRQLREAAKKPVLPEVKMASPSREQAGIPSSETKGGRETLINLGEVRQIRDQEWFEGLHQRRLWQHPDSLTEYTQWNLLMQNGSVQNELTPLSPITCRLSIE
jgi:hypothetical protein